MWQNLLAGTTRNQPVTGDLQVGTVRNPPKSAGTLRLECSAISWPKNRPGLRGNTVGLWLDCLWLFGRLLMWLRRWLGCLGRRGGGFAGLPRTGSM